MSECKDKLENEDYKFPYIGSNPGMSFHINIGVGSKASTECEHGKHNKWGKIGFNKYKQWEKK